MKSLVSLFAKAKPVLKASCLVIFLLLLLQGLVNFRRQIGNRPLIQESKDKQPAIRLDNTQRQKTVQRKSVYQELSPDGEHNVVLYEMPFTGDGELDYRNHLNNQYFYSVEDVSLSSGRETYIFVNDYKTGYPHWLGNEYIFFTSGCGTGCQGLYLVNIRSKESRLALLETDPLSASSFETLFYDWFDRRFRFPGWIKNIRAAFIEGKAYLIFQMWNNDQPIGEKRFLFTDKKLVEE